MKRAQFARLMVGLVVLAIVVVSADPRTVLDSLADVSLPLVLVAVAGLVAIHSVAAVGWRAILAVVGGPVLSLRSALVTYYAAQALGGVTPANIGGDIFRVTSLRRTSGGWNAPLASVVVQRATSYLALAAFALLALAIVAARTEVTGSIVLFGGTFAVVVALASWIMLRPPPSLWALCIRLMRLSGDEWESPPSARGLPRAAVIGFISGLGFHLGSIGLTYLLVRAIDPTIPSGPAIAALATARLSLAIPVTPSGLGVQEGALTFLFGAFGLSPAVALASMLLSRLPLVFTTLVGATLVAVPRVNRSSVRPSVTHDRAI